MQLQPIHVRTVVTTGAETSLPTGAGGARRRIDPQRQIAQPRPAPTRIGPRGGDGETSKTGISKREHARHLSAER